MKSLNIPSCRSRIAVLVNASLSGLLIGSVGAADLSSARDDMLQTQLSNGTTVTDQLRIGTSSKLDLATVSDREVKDNIKPDPIERIDPILEELAQHEKELPVIIVLTDQQQNDIARRIRQKYEPDIERLASQTRAIRQQYQNVESLESSEMESSEAQRIDNALSDDDEARLKELNIKREQLVHTMRLAIDEGMREHTENSQKKFAPQLQRLGIKLTQGHGTINGFSAIVPAEQLDKLAQLTGVAEVVYDAPGEPELDNQNTSLGTNSWWSNGLDGGIWDVGVLDSGVQTSHPALSSHTSYNNTVVTDPHGTSVACMYASTNSSLRGLAFGLDSIIADNAGSISTSMNGADWMMRSAGDDPEVINYSWGNGSALSSDWHLFSRFVDGIVSGFNTTWVKSAGNRGVGETPTMTVPGNNYNAITVANMDDRNTVTRSDDMIRFTSSRGPTRLGRKKPDITAPGHNTRTCNSSSGYSTLGGTSSAAPKVGAGALLMTDGGNWDPKAIKAVLINAADSWEDGGTPSAADDGPVSGKEWNATYGWGYLNLSHAKYHSNDFFVHTVRPSGQQGDYRFYKGRNYNGDKSTLVWERDVSYDNNSAPSSYRSLSDLDLRLFDEANNQVTDLDISVRDNVHQVAADKTQDSVVKVYAYTNNFDSGSAEAYALATEENFKLATGPVLATSINTPFSVARGATFAVTAKVRNKGDLNAHNVKTTLSLPAGYTLLSAATQNVVRLADGATATVSWDVRAPGPQIIGFPQHIFIGSGFIANTNSLSYQENFTASARSGLRLAVPVAP